MGHRNLVELQEEFTRGTLMLDLHDCDEDVKSEEEEEMHFSYGRAKFSLKDLLNTTVRKAERTLERASPYLNNATYFMITIDVACGLGSFDEEKELAKLRAAAAPPEEEAEPAAEEQPPAPEGEGEGEGDAEPKEEEPQPEPAQEPIADPNGAIYERVMYLIPYKSSQML